jgi:membrane protease YdiL (CAAX protease family)
MEIQSRKRTIRNLVIFTVSMVVIGWLGWLLAYLGGDTDSRGLGNLIWLVSPLVISLLLRAFAGDGWKDIGIKPNFKGNLGWYLVSIIIYPLAIALVLLIGAVLGGISFPGFSSDKLTLFMSALGVVFIPTFVKNIFEEFSWRGYLAPKMFTLGLNDFVAHLLVGMIWAIWHLPYYLGLMEPAQYDGYTSLNLAAFITLVFIALMTSSIAFDEIRFITGSTWPAVLMHTVSNIVIITLLVDNYAQTTSPAGEVWFTPGMHGILSIIVIFLIGIGLYRWRTRKMDSIRF